MNYLTCLLAICLMWLALAPTAAALEVVFAVNAAGEAFHDPHSGITYEADTNNEGKKHTWPTTLQFGGVNCDKQTIYKTVRYDDKKFGYDLPITGSGDYAVVLHFSDDQPTANARVYNVLLNHKHTILTNVDITKNCGVHNVCNEVVYFNVCNKQLKIGGELSTIINGKVRIEFVGVKFLPLVAAIAVIKGQPSDGVMVLGTKTVVFFDPNSTKGCLSDEKTSMIKPAIEKQRFLQQFFNITNLNIRVQNYGSDKQKTNLLVDDELL